MSKESSTKNITNPTAQHTQKIKRKTIGHYILGDTIGEGTFGKVKLGTHILTGEKVAVKILEKDRITDVSDVERVAREIHILKIIRHPYIIQLYEIIETSKQLYLITEYCPGGELFDYIVAHSKVKEKEACKFFQQLLSGVEYIHKLNIVHRDLKPENLLLTDGKSIKIVDFGLSNTYKTGERLKTACGSPCYAAPEMIAGKKYSGIQVDLWSCGVILFALLCGYLPFEDPNTAQLYKKILNGDYQLPKFLSAQTQDMLKCILNTDPAKRYTVEEIRKHPWYQLHQPREHEGIIVGTHQIPVDNNILNLLEKYKFDVEYGQKCIEANKHNHLTTTYYLLLKSHIRTGGKSNADLEGDLYEPTSFGRCTYTNSTRESPRGSGIISDQIDMRLPKADLNQTLPHPPSTGKQESNPKNRKYLELSQGIKIGCTGGSSSKDAVMGEGVVGGGKSITPNKEMRGHHRSHSKEPTPPPRPPHARTPKAKQYINIANIKENLNLSYNAYTKTPDGMINLSGFSKGIGGVPLVPGLGGGIVGTPKILPNVPNRRNGRGHTRVKTGSVIPVRKTAYGANNFNSLNNSVNEALLVNLSQHSKEDESTVVNNRANLNASAIYGRPTVGKNAYRGTGVNFYTSNRQHLTPKEPAGPKPTNYGIFKKGNRATSRGNHNPSPNTIKNIYQGRSGSTTGTTHTGQRNQTPQQEISIPRSSGGNYSSSGGGTSSTVTSVSVAGHRTHNKSMNATVRISPTAMGDAKFNNLLNTSTNPPFIMKNNFVEQRIKMFGRNRRVKAGKE